MTHIVAFAASLSGTLTDPLGSSPLVAAVTWLQGTLLGTIATTVAIVAVASVGIMMLSGRLNLRHGATVIMGCFVLFGASSIAAGIKFAATSAAGSSLDVIETPPVQTAGIVLPSAPVSSYDPYAGASVAHRTLPQPNSARARSAPTAWR